MLTAGVCASSPIVETIGFTVAQEANDEVGRADYGMDVYFVNSRITGSGPTIDTVVPIKDTLCPVILREDYRTRDVYAARVRVPPH